MHVLNYMHARYYDGALGRFLSIDPGRDWDLQQPQSWNGYAYVQNNPVNRVDPSGKSMEGTVWRGVKYVLAYFGREEKLIQKVNEISKRGTMRQIENAIKVAREEKATSIAVATEGNEVVRQAVTEQLSSSGRARVAENSGIWPTHQNPEHGPYKDIHVQTVADTKAAGFGKTLGAGLLAIIGANTIAANANKDATPGEVVGAFSWDVAKAIDPFFVTDAVEHFSGIGAYSEQDPSPPE